METARNGNFAGRDRRFCLFFKDGKGLACFWATRKLPVEREKYRRGNKAKQKVLRKVGEMELKHRWRG